MIKDIEKLLMDHEKYHSEFQIDNFIVGKSGDDWARYKQALREIETRHKSLINKREQLEIDAIGPPLIKKIALWVLRPRRVREIYANRRRRTRREMVADITEVERELARFVELAKALRERLGELTPEKRRRLECETWFSKARQMILIDSITNGGRPTERTLDFILGLPVDMQNELLLDFQPGQGRMIRNDERQSLKEN